jgi:hypothetical protein
MDLFGGGRVTTQFFIAFFELAIEQKINWFEPTFLIKRRLTRMCWYFLVKGGDKEAAGNCRFTKN